MLWKASRRLKSCWASAMVTQMNMLMQPKNTSMNWTVPRPMLWNRK